MLTRFVRIQLIIFGAVSVIGIVAMAVTYLQLPTLLGIGRITVTLELPATGALYRFSNVTVRGIQVGEVTHIGLTDSGAAATLSLQRSPRVPRDLHAEVRSLSAIGEQYVELLPRSDHGPYLDDGEVIPASDVTLPQPIGPMLESANTLLKNIPKDRIADLLDESYRAFGNSDFDFQSLIDSGANIARDSRSAEDKTTALINDGVPLIDSQFQTADAIRTWTNSLAGVTEQLHQNDPQIHDLLQRTPDTAQEVSKLLEQIKPTLPVLLANLTTVSQVAVAHRAGIQQLLVLLPPYIATQQSYGLPWNNPTGLPLGDFSISIADPPVCVTGFLPASQWRPPAATDTPDTPDGLYCKLPQDSPIGVRGVRNFPCQDNPGKRAPTAEICASDRPFEPLAMRPHALGPGPIDPNLIAQGIPPDSRIEPSQGLFGPLQGTPRPPDAMPAPQPGQAPPSPPAGNGSESPAPSTDSNQPGPALIAPSAHVQGATQRPLAVVTEYDPRTGRFITPDGDVLRQTSLVAPQPKSWTDLMPT